MISIQELRMIFPEFSKASDEELAKWCHANMYGKMSYEDFAKEFQAVNGQYQARLEQFQAQRPGRGGRSGNAGKQAGVAPQIKAMARAGYAYDKETDLFYPAIVDESGKRLPDYNQKPASDEYVAAVMKNASGASEAPDGNDPVGMRGVAAAPDRSLTQGELALLDDAAAEQEAWRSGPEGATYKDDAQPIARGLAGDEQALLDAMQADHAAWTAAPAPGDEALRKAQQDKIKAREDANSVDLFSAGGRLLEGLRTTYGKPSKAY